MGATDRYIPGHMTSHAFSTREFTFPESSWHRKKQFPSQPSILPALAPRIRDLPLQVKIEKLAKQRRKERVRDFKNFKNMQFYH